MKLFCFLFLKIFLKSACHLYLNLRINHREEKGREYQARNLFVATIYAKLSINDRNDGILINHLSRGV